MLSQCGPGAHLPVYTGFQASVPTVRPASSHCSDLKKLRYSSRVVPHPLSAILRM